MFYQYTCTTPRNYDVIEKCRYLHMPYSRVSFRMTLTDVEWVSETFNETKRRAVCLRQLSFLLTTGYDGRTLLTTVDYTCGVIKCDDGSALLTTAVVSRQSRTRGRTNRPYLNIFFNIWHQNISRGGVCRGCQCGNRINVPTSTVLENFDNFWQAK